MDPKQVQMICSKVYAQFPEVAGVRPKVRLQPLQARSARSAPRMYLLTFHVTVAGPGGKRIPRWVRVTSDVQGRIIKISTSHS